MIEAVLALVKRFPIWTAVGVFALGGYLFRDVLSGNVGDLKVGDCFDPPTLTAADSTVKDVQHHPCTDLHGGEVFYIGKAPGEANAAYPSDNEFLLLVGGECMPAYLGYTGRDFETDTTYDFSYMTPTAEGWTKGDRVIDCFVVRVDGQTFKGSVRAVK